MIWRSVIFSRALSALLAIVAVGEISAASVSGRVLVINSHDPEVSKRRDFANVVVWLNPLDRTSTPLPKRRAEMLQKDKKFTPHILVISKGTTVDFPNADPIFHNAFSNFEGKVFDIGLYPPGSSKSQVFDESGIVHVFCNIHPSMSAIIVVVDSPYFTKTSRDGTYSIANVLPGSYALHFFHERATPENLESLTRVIFVNGSPIEIATATISEAGYIAVAHKNKYGRDYPRDADQQRIYSSPAK